MRANGTSQATGLTPPPLPAEAFVPKGFELLRSGPTYQSGPPVSGISTLTKPLARATSAELEAFGKRDGVGVANKAELLPQMWKAIGFKPKMVYGLAEMGSSFGHAFIAFETANPKTGKLEYMVPNVCGAAGEALIQWCPLSEYLFGVDEFKGANKQRGIFNRPYTLVALNDDTIDTAACRAYVDHTLERYHKGKARFMLTLPRVANAFSWPLRQIGLPIPELGNCARWNAMFLREAGVFTNRIGPSNWVTQTTMWPKRLALRLVEGKSRVSVDNAAVIHIPRPAHAHITSQGLHDGQTYANLLTLICGKLGITTPEGRKNAQLANHAAAEVIIPPDTITGEVVVRPQQRLLPA